MSCVYLCLDYVPFLLHFLGHLKCGCRLETTTSVNCLENARALAGPFGKVAFIVSIGGSVGELSKLKKKGLETKGHAGMALLMKPVTD